MIIFVSFRQYRLEAIEKCVPMRDKDPSSLDPFARNTMPRISLVLLLLPLLLLSLSPTARVSSHQESGEWSCEPESEVRIEAGFKPGIITLDGHGDDWKDIEGSEFSLLPALDPDADKEYGGGKMTVKVCIRDEFDEKDDVYG